MVSTAPDPPAPVPRAPDPTDVAWRRAIAAVIDVGIGVAISIPLFAVLSEEVYRFDAVTRELVVSERLDGFGAFAFSAWLLAYNVGVFVLQRGFTGRTVGTLLLGVAVVGEDGRPLGPANALVRSVAGVVDYLPCCLPLVGLVTVFVTRDHQRVGDMAARSYGIDAAHMGRPVVRPVPPGAAGPAPSPAPLRPGAPPPPPGWSPPPRSTPPGPVAGAPAPPGRDVGPAAGPQSPPGPPRREMAPTPPPSSTPAPAFPDPPPPTPSPTPVWNPERGAYMAWDARRREWLQFDQATQRWLQYDLVRRRWLPIGPS